MESFKDYLLFRKFVMPFALQLLFWAGIAGSLYGAWWLDDAYSYNTLPFRPHGLAPEEVSRLCVEARRHFYSLGSMLKRGFDAVNRTDPFMLRAFFIINGMHRAEVTKRDRLPFGDPLWQGQLIKAA